VKTAYVIALCGALVLLGGCGRDDSKTGSSRPKAPAEKEWSREEMATNPKGYLEWADGQLATQISERQQRLGAIASKKKEIGDRRKSALGDYSEIENLDNILGAATRRAEEEDGWPVAVAGKSLGKEQAEGLLADIRQYMSERKSVASAYDGAFNKLDVAEKTLKSDLGRLTTLREKVGADLAAVKAVGSGFELEQLRKTEAEIAHYSKVLTAGAADSDVNVQTLPTKKAPPASLQSLMR
jgi:hypothetical protein